jgi:hypothetical protein
LPEYGIHVEGVLRGFETRLAAVDSATDPETWPPAVPDFHSNLRINLAWSYVLEDGNELPEILA